MPESGLVVEVTADEVSTHLTATSAVSATVLNVESTHRFDSAGGWLAVADAAPIEYLATTNSTITLAAGLAVAADETDPVTLVVAGQRVRTWLAHVSFGAESEPVPVPIGYEQREKWQIGPYDPPAPVLVADDLSALMDAPGRTPVLDLSYADPTTVPGGQAFSLYAPSSTDYPEGYGWWQVDAANKVLGFWRLVAGVWTPQTITTVEALQANNVLTTALTGQTITGATVQTRATGDRGVKLGRVSGAVNYDEALVVFDEAGNPFLTAVPAEGMAVIAGKLTANSLTVNGTATEGSSLGGVTEVTRALDGSAGALRLTAYTTAPKSAPLVTTGYDTVQFTADGAWGKRRGWVTDGTHWYTLLVTGSYYRIDKWNAAGAWVTSSIQGNAVGFGVAVDVANGFIYSLVQTTPTNFFVHKWNLATLAYVGAAEWLDGDGADVPAIGFDAAAGEILIAQSRPTNADKVRIQRYTVSGSTLTPSATAAIDTDAGWDVDLRAVYYGAADFGASRYVLANKGAIDIRVTNSTGVFQSAEYWQSGMAAKVGVAWNGTAFVSMDTDGMMRTYTGQDKAVAVGNAALTKWVSNTLANATLETDQSPRAKIVIPKRTKLNVTTSAINTGGTNAPDRVKVYVGQGATDPGRTAMWKQTDPAVGVTTIAYSSLATTGTNPPATNGFVAAGGTVQQLQLADGTVVIDGLGAGSAWTTYTPTWTAATTNPTIGNGTITGRYARIGRNTIKGNIVLTIGSTTTVGVGNYDFGLPVAARSLEEVVVTAIQTAPARNYTGRCPTTTSVVRLFLTSDFTTATNTTTGLISGSILRIDFCYEAA